MLHQHISLAPMDCMASNSNSNGERKGTEDNLDNSHLNRRRSFDSNLLKL